MRLQAGSMNVAIALLVLALGGCSTREPVRVTPVGPGWARNSVNTVIFRQHALTTHDAWQYTAYYDGDSRLVLARRRLDSADWETHVTRYTGNTSDAHNAISIAVDAAGILHVCWDHHNHPLRYARSLAPGSMELGERLPMTGLREDRVCYPEFYNLDDGGLLFMYRDGGAGRGDTLLNLYNPQTREWSPLQHPLIDGQGRRNAYPNQIVVDRNGTWHLSWNWREQGGVQTNHDICYARSHDRGRTWVTSTGRRYQLPITRASAEIVCLIPQDTELINHTTSAVDSRGRPMIATYWRKPGTDVPQYHLVWHDGDNWQTSTISNRTTPFRLSGGGTKRIPMSRPKLAVDDHDRIYMLFRDAERGDRLSVAICDDPARIRWRFIDLNDESLGMWEPNYDTVLWQRERIFHIFVQRVEQGDGDAPIDLPPQMVSVLEWRPH